MTEAYVKYEDVFSDDNIGNIGMAVFGLAGHFCTSSPKYVENDPIELIKNDLQSIVYLDSSMSNDLTSIKQIAFLDKLTDDFFDENSDDGFISYFAVEIDSTVSSCSSLIKSIQKILMKCSNRHTITLFRVEDSFLIAYGYRNVGKKEM